MTSGGTAMGKHSVACTACTPLAIKWLETHGELVAAAPAEGSPPANDEKPPAS